jgi:hypothetical protein
VTPSLSLVGEAVRAVRAVQGVTEPGAVGVSGVLAEQLVRELAAGADPGSVRVVDRPGPGFSVAVRVVAGDPTDEDRAFVVAADRASVPVVLVELWPQADWTPPFVLTPFVVECRAGQGFPVPEIAARIVEAAEDAPGLAARVPALRDAAASRAIRTAVARTALLALRGRSRPLLTLEQLRLVSQLRTLDARVAGGPPTPELAATAAGLLAGGFALRQAARRARRALPGPLANAAVAAAGTWLLAEALRRIDAQRRG